MTEKKAQRLREYLTQSTDPEHQALVQRPSFGMRILKKIYGAIISTVWPDRDSFTGSIRVSKRLRAEAGVTANLMGASNWLNAIGVAPVLQLGFASLGLVGIALTVVSALLLNGIGTWSANAAANRGPESEAWASIGRWGYALLNLLLSAISGAGILLLTTPAQISEVRARELLSSILDSPNRIEKMALSSPEFITLEEKCLSGIEEHKQLEAQGSPERHRVHTDLWGTWAERNTDWSLTGLPFSKWPICDQYDYLVNSAGTKAQPARTGLQEKFQAGIEQGLNDVSILEQQFPEVYKAEFTSDGAVKDSSRAVEIAFFLFVEAFQTARFDRLGFTLFIFSLSCLSSTVAVIAASLFAIRGDVLATREPEAEAVVDAWFAEAHHELDLLEEEIRREHQ